MLKGPDRDSTSFQCNIHEGRLYNISIELNVAEGCDESSCKNLAERKQ